MDNFTVNINCVVLSANIPLNKQFILSLDNNEYIPPNFKLDIKSLEQLDKTIIEYLKQHIFVNELELLPQLINLHSRYLTKEDDALNVIYGFVVTNTTNINNAYWLEFSITDEKPYSNLVLEVIQKLQ